MQIEISNETLFFLQNLSSEMLSQDNRATATPYYYIIKDREIRCVPDGCGDEVRYLDGNSLFTKEDLEKEGLDPEEFQKTDIVDRVFIPENHNVFLTEKACNRHIESNSHHFRRPMSYVQHAFRNPEMELLFSAIHEIAKAVRDEIVARGQEVSGDE